MTTTNDAVGTPRGVGNFARGASYAPFPTALDFEAQFDRLANAGSDVVQRFCLRVASGQLRNRGNIVAFLLALNDDVELALQWSILNSILDGLVDGKPIPVPACNTGDTVPIVLGTD
jgi:hypothetical protein